MVFLLTMILLISTFLVGCGGTDTQTSSQEGSALGEGSDFDNPATRRGNVLTVGGTDVNGIFNPITYSTVYDSYIIGLVFDTLLGMETDGTLVTEGGLLENYEISEDGLIYTFTLKEGLVWHDGQPITAEDIAFTYETIMQPDYKGRLFNNVQDIVGANEVKKGVAESAEGINVIDERTIEIVTTVAKATTLRNLAGERMFPIPKHYYDVGSADAMAELDREPIGNGPFKIKNYVVEQYVEFEPNVDYWQGTPKLDGIIYKVVANVNELSEFQVGSVDAVNFENAIENYETIEGPTFKHGELLNNWNNGYTYVSFNFKNPIFQDQRVRQALVYGVDRAGFVQSFFGDLGGAVAHSPISPVSWAYPEAELNPYEYSTEKANELLDEAGWKMKDDGFRYKDGEKLAFTWTSYNDAEWSVQFTALAKENWKHIGVDCEIELMDFNSLSTLVGDLNNHDKWDMFNMAWSLTADPNMQSTYAKEHTPPGNNRGYYANEEIEALMEEGVLELEQEKRKEIYQELAHKFNEDLPYIYVYTRMNPWLINKRVKNFQPSEFVEWYANAHEIEIIEN
ncbi:extracellular solute-binding protein, family 5 [Alkaliphilus metalliredigens QYMF]|uniref:Extracellular solute-binding protein, family 5 n=1 Tax=Alkaliphilus metalliredigens (strain QYMF) TaxID=293826 RepID=A6TS97_ALKMQ|nr:ABC transporter substrate-binding protein [Alkaliphilus metalliredigens]ABR49065.1 extracellular solute-binding protein, family 5 [Alkaliphilus metalliredigens QYMF]